MPRVLTAPCKKLAQNGKFIDLVTLDITWFTLHKCPLELAYPSLKSSVSGKNKFRQMH